VKVGVGCAVSARIVVPVFFNETINCEKYLHVERAAFSIPPVICNYFIPNVIRHADSAAKFACASQQAVHCLP
jgi:hypothetical protein